MILNRDQILKVSDLKPVEIEMPEWGGAVLVRGMTAGERDEFEALCSAAEKDKAALKNLRAKFATQCIVDESGNRLFNDKDVNALSEKSSLALNRIFDQIIDLSKLGKTDEEKAEKNS